MQTITLAEASAMSGKQCAAKMPGQPVLGWGQIFGSASRAVPSILDAGRCVLTRSARSAFALALRDAGIGPGARVLIPNYYCPTMIAPVERSGAVPAFYPITREGLPDMTWLRAHISADCKAMLAAHFFGLPVSLGAVREFCDRSGMVLIEDCAHAFFGAASGFPVGTVGDYALASLPKFFPVIEGGVLVSRTRSLSGLQLPAPTLASELKAAWNLLEVSAQYGRIRGLNAVVVLAARLVAAMRGSPTATETISGPAHPLSSEEVRREALADPLLEPVQLRRVENWVFDRAAHQRIAVLRRRNYQRLAELLRDFPGGSALFPQLPENAIPYVFPVRLHAPDDAYARLRASCVPVLRWDRYWPGAIESSNDVGRDWGHHVIKILCHQDLTIADIETIARQVMERAAGR